MQKLTQRQKMVLEFIQTTIDTDGYPPTLREIGNFMGIRSTNGVNDHLRALERKGYLTRKDMKSRTLRPTRAVERLLKGTAVAFTTDLDETRPTTDDNRLDRDPDPGPCRRRCPQEAISSRAITCASTAC